MASYFDTTHGVSRYKFKQALKLAVDFGPVLVEASIKNPALVEVIANGRKESYMFDFGRVANRRKKHGRGKKR
jgi:hypothetical protein